MAPKPVTIGWVTYRTKTAATAAVRAFMNSAELDAPLSGSDAEFAAALLEKHPHSADKIGCGVDHFLVRLNRFVGKANRGLWIKRVDGTEIDFSWVECLTPSTHEQRVKNAMRAAVQDDMLAFKTAAFEGRSFVECSMSGVRVEFTMADVHHVAPFLEIAREFADGDWESIKVDVGKEAAQIGDRFVDSEVEQRWIVFHRSRATLQIVHRTNHQSLPRT